MITLPDVIKTIMRFFEKQHVSDVILRRNFLKKDFSIKLNSTTNLVNSCDFHHRKVRVLL